MNSKAKYISSAFLLLLSSVIVKAIGAVYKIPLTAFIGAVGRGYFAAAYNLYIPLHSIIMGAFPIALSRLVSKYNASGNKNMLSSLKKGSNSLFFLAGFLASAVMLVLAKPYSELIASSPKSVYTILVLAPSLLFSCIASSYRGYYEGFMNMRPTSVSQLLEAFFKLIFGLLFAKFSMAFLYNSYLNDGVILGKVMASDEEALAFIYPITSAASMLGVTLGTLVSLLYLQVYHMINRDKALPSASGREGRKELFSFSLPIMISCAVQSVFQFLDTASVQFSLGRITPLLKTVYADELAFAGVSDSDLVTYVYGIFSTALDFKNLIPGITMVLGVCAVPAICRECERKNKERVEKLVNSSYKYTILLSLWGGGFIFLCSRDILAFFYGSSSPDIVSACEPVVKGFAVTVSLYSLASTAVFCVQAIGCPERSVSSYIISGVIRVVLNILLICKGGLLLQGAVISGAIGYFVLFLMNTVIVMRKAEVKIKWLQVAVKPLISAILGHFAAFCTINFLKIDFSLTVNLLIKLFLFSSIFYILCLFFGVLNFNEIFCGFNLKKMRSKT